MRLKPKQLKALTALLSGATRDESAKTARCSPSTLDDWLRQPEFLAEFTRLQDFQRDRVQGLLASMAAQMHRVITEAMDAVDEDKQPAHGIRLRGAELAISGYERLSKRGTDAQAPATGPLIILPGGAQPMALLIGGNGQAALAAGQDQQVIDAQAVEVREPVPAASTSPSLPPGGPSLERQVAVELEPKPAGLPSWWQAHASKSK